MYFKRKAYDRLLEWKAKYSDKYAALLEGSNESVNQRSRSLLGKMNTSLIF